MRSDKPTLNQQYKFVKTYSLKTKSAIDAINSKYSYEQVCFFLEVTLDIVTDTNTYRLLRRYRLNEIVAFAHIITTLVDSPYLTFTIRELAEFACIDSEGGIDGDMEAKERPFYMDNLIVRNYVEHLEWISFILKKKEFAIVKLMDDYFSKFAIYPRKSGFSLKIT